MISLDGVLVPENLKPAKARTAIDQIASHLYEHEQLRVVVDANRLRKPAATWVVVTNMRLLLLDAVVGGGLVVSWSATAGQAAVMPAKSGSNWAFSAIAIHPASGSDSFKVPLQHGGASAVAEASALLAASSPGTLAYSDAYKVPTAQHGGRLSRSEADDWLSTLPVYGSKPNAATARLIEEASSSENPWFVLGSTIAGALAAFDDRLVIVKAGAATGFMAGTLGGHRLATFYYTEINAIEYNAGMLNGVLRVLTASYQGSANSDYWRGTGQSRNADSNDPFTLSNTLPLDKITYRAVSPQMAELRKRINASRQPAASSSQASTASGLAGELARLAELHAAGVLSDDEFSSAKARLLAGE